MSNPDRTRQLIKIKEEIRACTGCHLHTTSRPVPYSGWLDQSKPSYAIVGEAPGPEENKQGKPFVGPAGKFLRKELEVVEKESGVGTGNTVFLNTVNCYPGTLGQAIRPPAREEREACRGWLIRQLELLEPSFVLVVGNTALNYWWSGRKIGESRGRWWTEKSTGLTVGTEPPLSVMFFSTYHPSAVRRERGMTQLFKTFRHDLKTFYEVGYMMWTARIFGVQQTTGAELEWLEEERGKTGVGRGRGSRRVDQSTAYDGDLFATED